MIQDIAKHFGGLKIIDFPVYVQGLELKQDSAPNRSTSQHNFSANHESNIRKFFIKKDLKNKTVWFLIIISKLGNVSFDGLNTGVQQDYVRQAANYADNVHYIRVNGADVQVN